MTPETANWVEQQLNVKLSPSFRQYLSAFPFYSKMFVVWEGLVYEPQAIVERTKGYRATGFFDRSWPHNYLAIGGDGIGNEFFLNMDDERSPVFLADHEACCGSDKLEFEQADESFELWVESMLKTEENTPTWLKERALEE